MKIPPINIISGNCSRLYQVCESLDKSKRWTVSIKDQKSKRSINQHGLMFLWVTELAAEQGMTKEEVHLYNKRKFFLPIYERDGEPYKDLRDTMDAMRVVYRNGDKDAAESMLRFVVDRISTTDANTAQMAEALDDMDKDAISRLQIYLPQPGEPMEEL